VRESVLPMEDWNAARSKEDVLAVLRRVGAPEEAVTAVETELGDPVTVNEAANVLLRYGITHDSIMTWMGSSP